MDIRAPVLAVMVGGAPAPGINSVISAVVLEGLNNGCTVIGIKEGFKKIKRGVTANVIHRFEADDVTNLYSVGGSFLRTSRETLQSAQEVDNVLRVFEHLRVRYLVCIGGTATAYSIGLVSSAAKAAKFQLSIVVVPKTIFNDLPLPEYCKTFGFETARETGVKIIHNFKADARTVLRWYIIVVMGQQAGHLALGIGKAAASTLTIIPEEYRGRKVVFSELCDSLEAAIIKRRALGKDYGVALLTEGLVDLMDEKELKDRFEDADTGHQELARHIVVELKKRFQARQLEFITVVSRNLGNELRCADPSASDIDLARDLGYGATKFLLQGGNGCMMTMKGNSINAIPLHELADAQSGNIEVRGVDLRGLSYEVALKYMIRLRKEDLVDRGFLQKLATAGNLPPDEVIRRFQHVVEERDTASPKTVMTTRVVFDV